MHSRKVPRYHLFRNAGPPRRFNSAWLIRLAAREQCGRPLHLASVISTWLVEQIRAMGGPTGTPTAASPPTTFRIRYRTVLRPSLRITCCCSHLRAPPAGKPPPYLAI